MTSRKIMTKIPSKLMSLKSKLVKTIIREKHKIFYYYEVIHIQEIRKKCNQIKGYMKEIITSIYSIYSHRHVQAEEIEPALCNETPKFHRLFLYIFVLTSEPKLTHFEFHFLKIDPSPLAL